MAIISLLEDLNLQAYGQLLKIMAVVLAYVFPEAFVVMLEPVIHNILVPVVLAAADG